MVSTIFYPDRDGTLNLELLPCAALRSCYCKKEIQSVVDMLRFSYGTGCALAKTRLISLHTTVVWVMLVVLLCILLLLQSVLLLLPLVLLSILRLPSSRCR